MKMQFKKKKVMHLLFLAHLLFPSKESLTQNDIRTVTSEVNKHSSKLKINGVTRLLAI